ncbi:SWPV1-081 [Shearwaterpox virus]|uniref:SWPV1-081 n=1 Tax=Shearwaterpox virus TaxID=1974596 RepID=A0A1V0S7T8_CNPV|nr:SWPV1-081 [Shearwaterpox virus]
MAKIRFIITSRKDIDYVLAKFHEITNYKYKLQCNRMGCYNKTIIFRNVQEVKLKNMIKRIRGLLYTKYIFNQKQNNM